MIDLHSHILPGLDDGARTLEHALELAGMAVEDGIRLLAATPHHNNGRYTNDGDLVKAAVEQLNNELQLRNIPLTVVPGQEIRINDRFWDDWQTGELLTLNGSRYMLIELPPGHVPENMEEFIHEMTVKGIVPIIAHPERNAELANEPHKLTELVRQGAWSQVTTHSINGLFGKKTRHAALQMCRRNLVHLVASDAHNREIRPFGMKEAYTHITNELGKSYADYYQGNAKAVVDNALTTPWHPAIDRHWYKWRK